MTSTTIRTLVDRYFDVISDGPLTIVRMPCIRREFSGRDARVSIQASPRWRDVLKAIGSVMRSHGFKLKNVYSIELIAPAAETPEFVTEWEKFTARIDAAFAGDSTIIPEFWLYEWKDGAFALVRAGAASGAA